MSDEEKKVAEFLSYKDSKGTEVCESIVIGSAPEKDFEDRIAFLKRHGCTDFVRLDADKKPIEPAK